MFRIIDGALYEGKPDYRTWDVRVFEVNGHREISARNPMLWEDTGLIKGNVLYDDLYRAMHERGDPPDWLVAERKEKKKKESAERAKTACRRFIKAEGFDELLTITYRENQQDRALCKKHFKEWVRRMRRELPTFRFCASFERQDRGAMHIHLACHKLPEHPEYKGVRIKAYQLGTKVWRSIVGEDNGLCFVGGKLASGKYRRNMSIAKMAAYVSKYILKDWEDVPDETNRYSRSNGNAAPKPITMRFHDVNLADLISLVFECGQGDVVVSHHASELNGRYWLCTERPRTRDQAEVRG